MDIKKIISQLTLDEKLSLLTGKNDWQTVDFERLGVDSFFVSDGPHGVRKQYTDENGARQYYKTVSFPTASAMAATWSTSLLYAVGEALASENTRVENDILLGPGVNIKRTPLCGRNFEYYSEDPLLAGELAAAYINGLQANGIGACIKHFAANNQEFDRGHVSSEVDERTLREIYLKPFEIAVKKSQPWSIMCAYNRLNGVYCSENEKLLQTILRDEWGFDGIVISDWGAVHNPAKALKGSLELGMPHSAESLDKFKKAYEQGEISDQEIDRAVERMLKTLEKVIANKEKRPKTYDVDKNRELARDVAAEAITLLKNEDAILPIKKEKIKKLAVIGQMAKNPIICGGGSAGVITENIESPFDKIKSLAGDDIEVHWANGYLDGHVVNAVDYLGGSMDVAYDADMAIVFVGNSDKVEAEGFDRFSLRLTPNMEQVIIKIAKSNPNTVVVIQAGTAIDITSWAHRVKGVVFSYYAGVRGASALADILFGITNPSGKTTETFPLCVEDIPSHDSYPGHGGAVWYKEGLMVGYRYYDTFEKEVLFPFGYGLSYTSYDYSDLKLDQKEIAVEFLEEFTLKVAFKVKNIGDMDGKEAVQLYVRDVNSRVIRPLKELKAFTKVDLKAGEEKTVQFELTRDAFAYFSTALDQWRVEGGNYEILIGASSRDIRLKQAVKINIKSELS